VRCLLIVKHGRPGGAEQPVLAHLSCAVTPSHSGLDPVVLTFITRTTIDVGPLLAVRHHSMSKARERGGRVPGFSTGVQTDTLVSSQPSAYSGGAAARRPGQSARPRIRTAPRIRSTGLADGRRTASQPPDGPAGVGRQVGREPLDSLRKVGRNGQIAPAVPRVALREAEPSSKPIAITGFRP
jgi:hypothetical protein